MKKMKWIPISILILGGFSYVLSIVFNKLYLNDNSISIEIIRLNKYNIYSNFFLYLSYLLFLLIVPSIIIITLIFLLKKQKNKVK